MDKDETIERIVELFGDDPAEVERLYDKVALIVQSVVQERFLKNERD